MKISVAMATYNGEHFIREQLESLGAQTRLPDELVVSDDGSTDRTLEILGDFARGAPFPVRIHPNESNVGYTRNFLRAARACTGDWVAFCDQDDIWLPKKLAIMERNSVGRDVLLMVHSAEIVDESLTPTGVRYPDFRRRNVYDGSQLPTWWIVEGFVMAFRADLIRALPDQEYERLDGMPAMPRGHDAAISRLARILGQVVVLPDRLALHRFHGAALTSGLLPNDIRGIRTSRKLFRRVRNVLSAFGADFYVQQAGDAANQAKIYRYLGEKQDRDEWRRKLHLAEAHYMAFSAWVAGRARLYREPRFRRRVVQLLRLARGYLRFNGTSLIGLHACSKAIFLDGLVAIIGVDRLSKVPLDEAAAVCRDRSSQR
ncbi:MAG TPA: glycosyltransferase family 2 protein [Steroidobacteraceae bacterium]|jgi:glycosyltransferase involved in cell wall biosynthesis